jgi:hypothetical protein
MWCSSTSAATCCLPFGLCKCSHEPGNHEIVVWVTSEGRIGQRAGAVAETTGHVAS